ncbi:S1 family peptidase [Luteimonas fraxinea]|uniref:S1 family peptidase n=1 Tax=Luteimonas fraxinea TaxID=2901869 RepID=A0ABS8UHC6_9GAMM|nr:S1 family peptidase [Luteimonas fraxinea]MCD9098058.1 S1 family peptidase [Luteimonas fraxinea]UHH09217.1 S1 family peptidase [Luteimonas fraxinea]
MSAKGYLLAASLTTCLGFSSYALAQSDRIVADPLITSYSQDYGVTPKEAARRMAQLGKISDLEQRLQTEIPDQFGGLVVVHQPTFHVKVFLTEAPAVTLSRFTQDSMFEAVQGTRPLELLQSAQAEISERLQATGIQHESGIDIESSELNFYVLDATTSKTAAAGELASVPYANMIQVPGFIETTATIQGGRQVSGSTQNCTTGFNVVHATSGLRGVTTAGHCDNTLTYSGTTLAFQAELNQGSDDFQWNRHAASTYPNQIFI